MPVRTAAVAAVLVAATLASSAPLDALAQRLAAPSGLACPRDRLTSFSGEVIGYDRVPGSLKLRIRSDDAHTTTIRLAPVDDDAARASFRIGGRPFETGDWASIELARSALRPPMRVIAWICEDGRTPPVIDWRPGEPPGRDAAR
ncbi:MAG: hypothetical protein ABIX12_15010 [Rubrivivax sp.]